MARLRLQSQLLLSTLLIICALAGAILLIIRQTIRTQIADQVKYSTEASIQEFETVQGQMKLQLSRTASLLAEIPTLATAGTEPDTVPHPCAERKLTDCGAILGTASYMAPEQARGEAAATTAIDVYGLGAILYELLTDHPPFHDINLATILRMVVEVPPAPPRGHDPNIKRDLEAICLKGLHKDSHLRYPSASAVADDLDRWLKGFPVDARPVSWPVRLAMWARREVVTAGLLVLVVMLVVALVLGVAWWFVAAG